MSLSCSVRIEGVGQPLTGRSKQELKRLMARLFKLYRAARPRNLSVILNYHSVHPAHESSTRPEDFLAQMTYLKANFSVISLAEFLDARTSHRELPAKTTMVTFDDGYMNNYEHAFPILKKLDLPATIFLTTGFVDGEVDITRGWTDYCGLDHLGWKQVEEMHEAGVFFGAHTHNHPILSTIPVREAEEEIVRSKEVLEEKLHHEVKHFAYPLGQPHTFNSSIVELLKKHGFDPAVRPSGEPKTRAPISLLFIASGSTRVILFRILRRK